MPDVTMPNGDIVNFPDDMPKEQIKSLIASKFPEFSQIKPMQASQPTKEYSGLRSFAEGAVDMGTFGFGDEIVSKLASMASGVPYEDIKAQANLQKEETQTQHPYAYGSGQLAGAIGTPVLAAPKVVAKGLANVASKGFTPSLAASSGLGAVSGGIYGAGSGEGSLQERLPDAQTGFLYGGAGGAIGSGVARVAAPVVGGLAKRAMKLFPKKKLPQVQTALTPQQTASQLAQTQQSLPPVKESAKAASVVLKQLKKDFGEELDTLIDAYKKGDMSLAEFYGKRTSSLAQGAAVYPSGRAIAEKSLGEKTGGSYDRVLSAIRKNISGVDSYYTNADDLINVGRAKAAPLYEKAYEQSIDNTDVLMIPEIQSALKQAYKKYPSELAGAEPNSIKALDYAKRVLDDQVGKAQRAGEINFARSRTIITKNLLNAMDEASPAYKQARSKAGDYLSVNNAMEQGRKALRDDSEIIEKTLKGLGDQEKQAYKIGLGKAVRDEIGKVSEGANPYKRILGSPEKRAKIQKVLSPKEYIDFEQSLRAEDDLFNFRNKVLGGSPTADKLEAQKLIEAGAIDSLSGVPKRTFTEALTTFKTKLLDGMNDNTAAKVSEILYETDPVKKLQIIKDLKGNKALTQPEKELVKRAYALISPRYDALRPSQAGALAGGEITSATFNNGEQ